MVRRDAFVQRYVEQNNPKIIETEVIELEKFVDQQLVDINVLLDYVNQNGLAGTSGVLQTQYVNDAIINNTIHRDTNVLDNGSGRTGNNKQYAIWSDGLTTANGQSASATPWFDLTIDTTVTGEIHITLPVDTNKNAAYLLLQKYLGPLQIDSTTITQNQVNTLGFWGRKPIPGSNGTSALLDANAVRLEYNSDVKRFIMIFTL